MRHHPGHERTAHFDGAEDVGLDRLLERVLRYLQYAGVLEQQYGCVVYHDVDGADFSYDFVARGLDARDIGDVHRYSDYVLVGCAEPLACSLQCALIAARHHDPNATSQQLPARFETDAAICSGDQGDAWWGAHAPIIPLGLVPRPFATYLGSAANPAVDSAACVFP
jgi:hypothetical protein